MKGGNFKALDEYSIKESLSDELFEAVIEYYKKELGVHITSFRNIAYNLLLCIHQDTIISNPLYTSLN